MDAFKIDGLSSSVVDHTEEPPPGRFYKSRKARPCDACRRRKVMCHMPTGQPCRRCRDKTLACTFNQAPDKKKRPPRPPCQQIDENGVVSMDDVSFFSFTAGQTPTFLDVSEASRSHDHHPHMQDTDARVQNQAPWGGIHGPVQVESVSDHPTSHDRVLLDNEPATTLDFDFPWESYNSLSPPFPSIPNAVPPSPGNERYGHLQTATGPSPGSSTTGFRNSTSPKLHKPSSHQPQPATTQADGSFTTDGSLEVLPDAFSFYIGPTGVSDSLLLQRDSFGADGVAAATVKGLQYRRVAPPPDSQFLGEGVNHSEAVLFGITDHALLDKAEPRAESGTPETTWASFWQVIDHKTAWSLLQLYGRFVDTYFPVVSPYQLPATPGELMSPTWDSSQPRRMSLALLSAMCAAALPFVVHDRSLYSLLLRPPSSDQLYRMCWQGITQELHAPTLCTLQACLLLQQRLPTNLYLHDTAFAWSLMATAVSVSQTVGLHRDPTTWTTVPAWERRLRRRLWWTLWTTDAWVSLTRGMPPHLGRVGDDESSDVETLRPSDIMPGDTLSLPANVDTGTDRSNYMLHLVNLTAILADIQHSFYTLRATRQTSTNLAHAMAVGRPLHSRLQAWRDALPSGLRFSRPWRFTIDSILSNTQQDDSGVADFSSTNNISGSIEASSIERSPQQLDGNTSLHLSYIVTHMMLFRALLRPLDYAHQGQGDVNGSPDSSRNEINAGPSIDFSGTDEDARNQAVTRGALLCVREFVEFVEAMTPTHWNAFWHGWSRANFAMAGSFIVYLLHTVTMRRTSVQDASNASTLGSFTVRPGFAQEYRELLVWIRRWRWASRVSVNGAAGAKGLTNLMLLRVETFLGELGGLGELKD